MAKKNKQSIVSDCQKTTALSLRDPEGGVAISQNHLATCMYSGEYETFLLDCTRRGYAASVTLVPRERLRYHVASLLAMTCRGLFRHAAIVYVIGIAALLVIAYYSRAFQTQVDEPILKMLLVMLRSVIQISLVIAWCSSVRTRIINQQVRHYLIVVGILPAFWLILRTCKWEFIAQNGTHLGRYLWYAYYIPMVYVPLLGVFIIDRIGKTENYKTPNSLKYLYIPATFPEIQALR